MSTSRSGVRQSAHRTPARSLPSRPHSFVKRVGALLLALSVFSVPAAPLAFAVGESTPSTTTSSAQPTNENSTVVAEPSEIEAPTCVVPGPEYFFFAGFRWVKWWIEHPDEVPCLDDRSEPEPGDATQPEPEPSGEAEPSPTDEPTPTPEPTADPSEEPAPTPGLEPTDEATPEPEPSGEPTPEPTQESLPHPEPSTEAPTITEPQIEPKSAPSEKPELEREAAPKPQPQSEPKDEAKKAKPTVHAEPPAEAPAPEKRLETADPEANPTREAQPKPESLPSRATDPSPETERPERNTPAQRDAQPEPESEPLPPAPAPEPEPSPSPGGDPTEIPALTMPGGGEPESAPPGVRLNPTAAPTDGSTPRANDILGDEDEKVDTILSVWTNPDGSALGSLKTILAGTVAVGVTVAGGLGALTLRARAKKP